MKKIIFILGLVFFISGVTIFHFYHLDGLHGYLISCLLKDDTIYASGYSDNSFRKIKKGMSQKVVLELLGEPLNKRKLDNSKESWFYSKSARLCRSLKRDPFCSDKMDLSFTTKCTEKIKSEYLSCV